ncbi:MAG TPA: hypothetical protein VFX59_09545 [Polyangiales bacterium]|nr:hypothetical protein [Polyangiales bacterium]
MALCACVAPESGNPSQRCNDSRSCEAEQFCYRGFCVEDEQEVDPVMTFADASGLERDAAAPVGLDASLPTEAGASDAVAATFDAGGEDAAVRDASVRDTGVRDAGKPRDAGVPCQLECKPPAQKGSPCKKCVKSAFGEEPDKLCGQLGHKHHDDDKVLGADDPICIALCLGAASKDPKCGGLP